MTEQRRVGFQLPSEVYEQLLEEALIPGEDGEEQPFWYLLMEYYHLIPIQGDSVIASADFIQFIQDIVAYDRPAWVHEQDLGLKKMQCLIIAGPSRGQALLDTLKMIDQQRDEAAQEAYEENKYNE